jgi:preprotein translocase subunit SecE
MHMEGYTDNREGPANFYKQVRYENFTVFWPNIISNAEM